MNELCHQPAKMSRLACLIALVALAVPLGALASENGKYYTCLPLTNDLCVFQKTSDAPSDWGTLSENTVDRSGAAYYRHLTDSAGTELKAAPKPWTQGDKEATTTTKQSGSDWNWVLAAELGFPLRNAVMYGPAALTTAGDTEWAKLTRAFKDCHIKEADETHDVNGNTMTVYGRDSIWKILKAPKSNSVFTGMGPSSGTGAVHNQLLQFLEEGCIDLVCLMTTSSSVLGMDRCKDIRAKWGLSDTQMSDCWQAAYKDMYGADAVTDSTFTNGTWDGSKGNGAARTGASTAVLTGLMALAVLAAAARD